MSMKKMFMVCGVVVVCDIMFSCSSTGSKKSITAPDDVMPTVKSAVANGKACFSYLGADVPSKGRNLAVSYHAGRGRDRYGWYWNANGMDVYGLSYDSSPVRCVLGVDPKMTPMSWNGEIVKHECGTHYWQFQQTKFPKIGHPSQLRRCGGSSWSVASMKAMADDGIAITLMTQMVEVSVFEVEVWSRGGWLRAYVAQKGDPNESVIMKMSHEDIQKWADGVVDGMIGEGP
jgi:hypothetical protein